MPYNVIKIQSPTGQRMIPVVQELIYVYSCLDAVQNELNVKYVFTIGGYKVLTTLATVDLIGQFKTTPNNAGVGMMELSNLMSSYVGADNMSKSNSTWKSKGNGGKLVPIHIIDRYSLNSNAVHGFTINCQVEYTDSSGTQQITPPPFPSFFIMMNAYIKNNDPLFFTSNLTTGAQYGGGYDMQKFEMSNANFAKGNYGKFLSNSPTTQWARPNDYGTMSYVQIGGFDINTAIVYNNVSYYKFTFYPEYDAGGTIVHSTTVDKTKGNGAFDGNTSVNLSILADTLLYFGAFPGNIRAIDGPFSTKVGTDILSYTVETYNAEGDRLSETKIVNIACADHKGYEPIRLTWLNQWGTWDYYTFMQKSIKTIKTKSTTYSPTSIQWNSQFSTPSGASHKGGKKTFRVNATETIKMNTDYVTEEHSEWFEELINSPEVYQLRERYGTRTYPLFFSAPVVAPTMNEYVTPVTLKTTSLVKKTRANDGLVQYTFEVEKSKELKTQTI
tara:strand:+ start:170 stop:1669 length:1500 start_codon:yes stop_codon:yes gene_type:complete